MTRVRLAVPAMLLLGGCAVQPIYVPLPPCHPASPCAPESPIAPPTGTLAIHSRELMPADPDWQIPGMRDHEKHEHATGPFPMSGGSMMGGHSPGGEPGMVKMEAPPGVVDYAPPDAAVPSGAPSPGQDEHRPELHLEHTSKERREAPTQQAPVAPPAGKQMTPMDGHEGHGDEGKNGAPPQAIPSPSEHGHH